VLQEHGVAITRRFYADLFEAHPELRHVFNQGNQGSGAQQGALAGALVAYAANIDNRDALAPVVRRIAHKHASLGIGPAQYTVVARHLLAAIGSVLGAAATPALLAAWDEAYWLLAGELIAAEARLYERAQVTAGELQPLTVSAVQRETDEVVSLWLQTAQGGSPGSFIPGQYVSVQVELPDGLRQQRQYSLSDAPGRPHWRITIKRETDAPAGRVSNHLHDHVKRGDVVQVGPAFGDFQPAPVPGRPLALVSAGVGITPMISVLNALADRASREPVLFAHAARSRDHHVLRAEVERARDRLPGLRHVQFYEAGSHPGAAAGRMTWSDELRAAYADAEFFLCGPDAFMRAQWRALVGLGVSPARLHREVFGPDMLAALD
jgi:nitric oxide dioxygenase